MVVTVSIPVIVGTVVIIISPRRMLTFFVPPFGPTVQFVVPLLVAIVALGVAPIMLLLHACGEGFILAILALLSVTALVLICDKSDNTVRNDPLTSLVSCGTQS